ncbi:Crp/Fnr family transcriptional regulator [Rhizobium sp. R72]|uniref:Crp/Fnr family transcriptional regulator n=1 Tax=unclassified Rhizobium TaxID=2613769 RepID=UPI000B52DBF0|nr:MULTISPECIES: Crp/Fnr family transcriptional regulator [unclassified Rhizobium]OWW02403.1 Crp/Fnr family transcriptional regulator [Rhizobium sp. R72]OWW02537.1 Crp/Fnr family transcriptional regulator [Rhizobium sp. R711]
MTANRTSNRLLSALSDEDYELIKDRLEEVDMPHGLQLAKAGEPFGYAFFPSTGIASVIAVSATGRRAEAGMAGHEGFAPIAGLLHPGRGPFDIVVQVAGHGLRLPLSTLHDAMDRSRDLTDLLLRYVLAFHFQVAYTAFSNASHTIDIRLARWILMSQDRMQNNELALTHDYISLMLAVRRPSVTIALHTLEGERLIRSERANVIVRDRKGLETFAGDAYGVPEREYCRLIDQERQPSATMLTALETPA